VLASSRFALTAILARRLSVEVFGQVAYGQWLVDLAFLVCSLGMGGVAGRYLAEYRHDAGRFSAIAKLWQPFAVGLPVLSGVAALAGAWIAGLDLDATSTLALVAWATANGLWAMQTAALAGLQRFDLILRANVVAAVLMIGSLLLLPLDSGRPGAVFAVMACSASVAALVGFRQTARIARGSLRPLGADLLRDVRRYAFNIWLTALMWSLVWSRGEIPVVHAYLGNDGVAKYAVALTLFGGAVQGVMLAVSGVGPHLTRLWGEGAQGRAIALAREIMDLQLVVCAIAALLLICIGPELLSLAFGSTYAAESGVLAILSVGILAMAVSCQGHLLQIATDAQFNRDTTMLSAVFLFGSAIWLVVDHGLYGAALARAVTMLLLAAATLFMVRHKWGVGTWSMRNAVSSLVVVGSVVALVHFRAGMPWHVRVLVACFASLLIIGAVRDERGRVRAVSLVSQIRRSLCAIRASARKAPRS